MNNTAVTAFIFILALLRTFLYEYFPENIQAYIWNISGAAVIIILLLVCFWKHKSYSFLPIICWWIYEELLVIFCSFGRIFFKWPNIIGMDQLSEKFNIPCVLISLSIAGYLAVLIYKENKRAALKS